MTFDFGESSGRGPSAASRAAWAGLAQSAYRLEEQPLEQSVSRRWLTPRRVGGFLALDALVGMLAWQLLGSGSHGPAAAVTRLVAAAHRGDWSGARHDLCQLDQSRVSEAQVAAAGRSLALTVRGIDRAEVTSVGPLAVADPTTAGLPTRLVTGMLHSSFGQPTGFTVTVVLDAGGWRPCLSVGGYSSEALGVSVPLGEQGTLPGSADTVDDPLAP